MNKMIVRNHNNEDTEIISIKRKKAPNSVFHLLVKVCTIVGSTEYYPYEDFQEFNPEFNWGDIE